MLFGFPHVFLRPQTSGFAQEEASQQNNGLFASIDNMQDLCLHLIYFNIYISGLKPINSDDNSISMPVI